MSTDDIRRGLVKPLIWDGNVAECPFGVYHIARIGTGHGAQTEWTMEFARTYHGNFYARSNGTSDSFPQAGLDGKAAAQADYEQRILSALDLTAIEALVRERDEARAARLETNEQWRLEYNALATENARLKGLVGEAVEAVAGVIAEADRNTDAFIRARALLTRLREAANGQ